MSARNVESCSGSRQAARKDLMQQRLRRSRPLSCLQVPFICHRCCWLPVAFVSQAWSFLLQKEAESATDANGAVAAALLRLSKMTAQGDEPGPGSAGSQDF